MVMPVGDSGVEASGDARGDSDSDGATDFDDAANSGHDSGLGEDAANVLEEAHEDGAFDDGEVPNGVAGRVVLPGPPRSAYVTRRRVERYGLSQGCAGCLALKHGRAARNHTQACRDRMQALSQHDGSQAQREDSQA